MAFRAITEFVCPLWLYMYMIIIIFFTFPYHLPVYKYTHKKSYKHQHRFIILRKYTFCKLYNYWYNFFKLYNLQIWNVETWQTWFFLVEFRAIQSHHPYALVNYDGAFHPRTKFLHSCLVPYTKKTKISLSIRL